MSGEQRVKAAISTFCDHDPFTAVTFPAVVTMFMQERQYFPVALVPQEAGPLTTPVPEQAGGLAAELVA